MFNYFLINKLFTPSQSDFLRGESSIAQLLSIIHDTQTAFDSNPTVDLRVVFSSKPFDKVWHDGFIFKLKSYGVDGKLLSLLKKSLKL